MKNNFEIIRVKSAGFCFGVKRAVNKALEIAEKYKGEKIYTIGPIIHNNDVVRELEEKGVKVAKSLDIDNSIVILRSHGVEKNILKELKRRNNKIVDAICPYVKKIHSCVNKLKKEKYFIVIIGDMEHPEVKAIASYAENGNYTIVNSSEDIDESFKRFKKIGIVAQTTQSLKNYLNICSRLLPIKAEFRIFNTICNSTSVRQEETIEVAKRVDCMIVIGGRHSANTRRLYNLSKDVVPETYHIENEKELDLNWIMGKKKIGITAGASTPEKIINKVIEKIRGLK